MAVRLSKEMHNGTVRSTVKAHSPSIKQAVLVGTNSGWRSARMIGLQGHGCIEVGSSSQRRDL